MSQSVTTIILYVHVCNNTPYVQCNGATFQRIVISSSIKVKHTFSSHIYNDRYNCVRQLLSQLYCLCGDVAFCHRLMVTTIYHRPALEVWQCLLLYACCGTRIVALKAALIFLYAHAARFYPRIFIIVVYTYFVLFECIH